MVVCFFQVAFREIGVCLLNSITGRVDNLVLRWHRPHFLLLMPLIL